MGLSLRDLQEVLYLFVGHSLSRTAVNRITGEVQDTMTTWRSQPLDATPPVLLVDGVWVKILYPTGQTWTDASGHVRQEVRGEERVILAGLAVWPDGRHAILHYEVAVAETQDTWAAFLRHLLERGLDPNGVHLVVSDGRHGLLEAMAQHLQQTASQRCTEHSNSRFEFGYPLWGFPRTLSCGCSPPPMRRTRCAFGRRPLARPPFPPRAGSANCSTSTVPC